MRHWHIYVLKIEIAIYILLSGQRYFWHKDFSWRLLNATVVILKGIHCLFYINRNIYIHISNVNLTYIIHTLLGEWKVIAIHKVQHALMQQWYFTIRVKALRAVEYMKQNIECLFYLRLECVLISQSLQLKTDNNPPYLQYCLSQHSVSGECNAVWIPSSTNHLYKSPKMFLSRG